MSKEGNMIDIKSVTIVVLFYMVATIVFLVLFYMAGYDLGRRNLVVDIDSYGCEKVLAIYHGIKRG